MQSPTPQIHLPLWLQGIVASTGGLGLFLIAFLDSSILTFPIINDLLLIDLSIHYPARMPYYAGMATLGSVEGRSRAFPRPWKLQTIWSTTTRHLQFTCV